MKKRFSRLILFCGLLLTAALLAGCSAVLVKQLKEKAEAYLSRLERNTAVSDHFSIRETPKVSERTGPVDFTVFSETYQDSFKVSVSRDGTEITDNYYTLYLQQEAEETVAALFRDAVPDPAFTPQTAFYPSQALAASSGHAAGSVRELYALCPGRMFLTLHVRTDGQADLSDAQIDRVLLALQEEGLYARFYPYQSDAVWFEILPDGFWKNLQSGADSGAYLQKTAYTPAS